MKQRMLAALLAAVMLLSLCACGGESAGTQPTPPVQTPEVTPKATPETTPEPTPEVTPTPEPTPTVLPDDPAKNLSRLRHNASFEMEAFSGVYWVPVNTLGFSRYTNEEISAMLDCTPQEKQEKISTLYEALQLYQIGAFHELDITDYVETDYRYYNISWEQSPPGECVVLANGGDDASCASWLNYLLADDYDECGYVQVIMAGGGHVFNYLKQGEWYYFIDLTAYQSEHVTVAVEDGGFGSYITSYRVANLHRTKSPQDYADFVMAKYKEAPVFMMMYTAEGVLDHATKGYSTRGFSTRFSTHGLVDYQILYDDPEDDRTYEFLTGPEETVNWSKLPNCHIFADQYSDDPPPMPTPSFAPQSKDLTYLRHDASFELEVSPGIYWVPVNSLGSSRYTNEEIAAMLDCTPQEKQEKISTLYEAMQLYQVGNFRMVGDAESEYEYFTSLGIAWEENLPGEVAVKANCGDCAGSSSWLHYILDGDYDECGYIHVSQLVGGHVYNYIKQGEWYYFLDMSARRNDRDLAAVETGTIRDYGLGDGLADLHKTKSPWLYYDYILTEGQPTYFAMIYTAAGDRTIDGLPQNGGAIFSTKGILDYQVLYDDPNDSRTFSFVADLEEVDGFEKSNDQNYIYRGEVLESLDGMVINSSDIALKWTQWTVPAGEKFGGGIGRHPVAVMVNGVATNDFTVESSNPEMCTCTKIGEGMFELNCTQPGESWLTITCGKASAKFRWVT